MNDDSVIIISDDEDRTGFRNQPDKQISVCNNQDDEEQMPSSSRFRDNDISDLVLLEECSNNAAFLHSPSSDDEQSDSLRKLQGIFDEKPECEDLANWYSNESFSQPAQSVTSFKETPLITDQPVIFSTSPNKSAMSISIVRSTSDSAFVDKKRRKRTKDEIFAEKAAKAEAKLRKEQERARRKKQIELEKQIAKFQREISAAKKSKCEQNLFCFISLDLLTEIENLDEVTTKIFEERNIRNQLVFDGTGMRIYWKRRILQGEVENDEFVRSEKLVLEQFFILSMGVKRYSEFKSAEEIADFVEEYLKKNLFPSARLTIVVYGLLKLRKEKVADFVLEIFERYRVQTHFVLTTAEYAMLIAQMHRAIARNQSYLEEKIYPIVNIEKGITEGDNSSIVSDWWMKMLSQIHRMGTDAQRAIVNRFPNPHTLSQLLKAMPMKEGIKMLSDTKLDYGRRIGPVIARKIYLMLTSVSGTEIIDEN
uniref:ERCC4 domain-containing protein n=1 Tax=Setaria digitata TaxID=48799 RepID=A0A915Q096_9BILA